MIFLNIAWAFCVLVILGLWIKSDKKCWNRIIAEQERTAHQIKLKEQAETELAKYDFIKARNEYIRFLLKSPSPTHIEDFLSGRVIRPYHLSLKYLSKQKLKKELEEI